MQHQWGHRSGAGKYINSTFGPNTEVFGSPTISYSVLLDRAMVFGGQIMNSNISEDAIFNGSRLIHTVMRHRSVMADQACAFNSYLGDEARVLDKGSVSGVIMTGHATVCGTGIVIGGSRHLILSGHDYIDRGVWFRRPATFISSEGRVVTENVGQLVTVGCTTNTVEKWLGGAGRRYGKIVGMTKAEIDEVQGYVEQLRDMKAGTYYDMK